MINTTEFGTSSLVSQGLINRAVSESFYLSPFLMKPIEQITPDVRFEELKRDIGENLFDTLSYEDQLFILDTEGSMDLGYEAKEEDLNRVARSIEED